MFVIERINIAIDTDCIVPICSFDEFTSFAIDFHRIMCIYVNIYKCQFYLNKDLLLHERSVSCGINQVLVFADLCALLAQFISVHLGS